MKQGWTYKPLGEIVTFIKDGDWIESKDQSESGIRLIQTGNVGNGVFKIKDDRPHFITEETMVRLGCTEIFEGDCLVSRLPNPVGRACLIPDIGCRMITAVDCSIIRFGVNYLPKFFVYYTQSSKYLNSIDDKTTGTTRKRISRKNLEKIQIPVLPPAEQERIVERLDAAFAQIDELKSNAERQLAEARALFQSALTQAMQPKPGWQEKTLGEIATDMYRGSGIRRDQITKEGIPCVRYGEIYTTYNISFEDCVSHTLESSIASPKYFEHGDLLFAITGESVEDIGKTIAYMGNEKCLLGGDIICMKHNQNPKFLSYALSTTDAIKQKGFGKTKLKVVHTNAPSLKAIRIPLPPLPEQQSIVEQLDSISTNISLLEEINQKIKPECDALKQALLRQIFE